MNINNNQTQNSDAQCCVDYCRTSYHVAGQEVVNKYRCNQQTFAASDMWQITRTKKELVIKIAIQ